ncbi:hypothetical protein [Acetobacter persici]|uniref:hypothetical protein n=1 Tax=Acetobacter persici TaxID=1076596 RepID=UPI0012FD0624|nr:hypothetical protein [Acetobacter persici]
MTFSRAAESSFGMRKTKTITGTSSNIISSETSIALGIIRPIPNAGNQWKMSDGNGVVTVSFDDKDNGDFLTSLRTSLAPGRVPIAKDGDILLCIARQTQHIDTDKTPHILTKTIAITKVTAISKRMILGK